MAQRSRAASGVRVIQSAWAAPSRWPADALTEATVATAPVHSSGVSYRNRSSDTKPNTNQNHGGLRSSASSDSCRRSLFGHLTACSRSPGNGGMPSAPHQASLRHDRAQIARPDTGPRSRAAQRAALHPRPAVRGCVAGGPRRPDAASRTRVEQQWWWIHSGTRRKKVPQRHLHS